MQLLSRILISAFALIVVARVIPGIHIDGIAAALIGACVLGIMNGLVRPILVILTLPISILTLGLFIFILNGALFFFVSTFVPGFTIDSFGAAFLGSILVSIISYIAQKFI